MKPLRDQIAEAVVESNLVSHSLAFSIADVALRIVGNGKRLEEENARLRDIVALAFKEGFRKGIHDAIGRTANPQRTHMFWKESQAFERLNTALPKKKD
jgi:hypothetical protein